MSIIITIALRVPVSAGRMTFGPAGPSSWTHSKNAKSTIFTIIEGHTAQWQKICWWQGESNSD